MPVTDLLLAAIGFPLSVALAVALLATVTLAPWTTALRMADARGFSVTRWGALALLAAAVGLLLLLLAWRSDRVDGVVVLLPLLVTWSAPGALWLLSGQETAVGGRAGVHERR